MIKLPILILLLFSQLTSNFEEASRKEANQNNFEIVTEEVDLYRNLEAKGKVEALSYTHERPEIEEVPLDSELLDYIYAESEKADLSYTLVLAIMKVESNFDPNVVSATNDYGLAQIHRPTAKWIASQLGLSSYDLKDPYTSTDFCIYYLMYLRDKYRDYELSEEDVFDWTIISYNRGENGAKSYIKRYGIESNSYWKKVVAAKEELEMNIIE